MRHKKCADCRYGSRALVDVLAMRGWARARCKRPEAMVVDYPDAEYHYYGPEIPKMWQRFCLGMRSPGGTCGPDAQLFEPR